MYQDFLIKTSERSFRDSVTVQKKYFFTIFCEREKALCEEHPQGLYQGAIANTDVTEAVKYSAVECLTRSHCNVFNVFVK